MNRLCCQDSKSILDEDRRIDKGKPIVRDTTTKLRLGKYIAEGTKMNKFETKTKDPPSACRAVGAISGFEGSKKKACQPRCTTCLWLVAFWLPDGQGVANILESQFDPSPLSQRLPRYVVHALNMQAGRYMICYNCSWRWSVRGLARPFASVPPMSGGEGMAPWLESFSSDVTPVG